MIIQPETLKTLRKRNSMSQADLSRATVGPEQVSVSTIKRIESAKGEYKANARVAKKLAQVLKIQPEGLAKEPREQGNFEDAFREHGYRPLKTVVDGETYLAFQLVEHIYGIPIQSQILMAPLFSALLAEGSLAWRREQLSKIEAAANDLLSRAEGHFSFAGAAYRVENGALDEKASIASRDLFGKDVGEDTFDLGFDSSQNNPFVDYLKEFIRSTEADNIELADRYGDTIWKTTEGLPNYCIFPKIIEKLTSGDYWAEFALIRGFTRIRDIPKELLSKETTEERVKWLSSKVPPEERERWEEMAASTDLAALGLSETPKQNTEEE